MSDLFELKAIYIMKHQAKVWAGPNSKMLFHDDDAYDNENNRDDFHDEDEDVGGEVNNGRPLSVGPSLMTILV